MKNLAKLKKNGLWSAARRSALVFATLLALLASPAVSFAQTDAGHTADPVAATAAAPELPPAEPAPVVESAPAVTAKAPAPQAAPIVVAPATQTSLDKLSSEILNVLIPTFVTAVGLLSVMFLNWLSKKTKLDVSNKQIAAWSAYAEIGAARAGEWVRNKTKTLAEGETIPGPEILEVAANFAIDLGREHGLPELGREKLEGLIESHLNRKRGPDLTTAVTPTSI